LIKGFKTFNLGLWNSPLWVRIWIFIVLTINVVVSWWFIDELAAQMTILACFGSGLIAFQMCETTGYNKYLALMHGPLIPIVYFHCYTLCSRENLDPNFRNWVIASIVTISLVLIIDATDLVKYQRQQSRHKNQMEIK